MLTREDAKQRILKQLIYDNYKFSTAAAVQAKSSSAPFNQL